MDLVAVAVLFKQHGRRDWRTTMRAALRRIRDHTRSPKNRAEAVRLLTKLK